MTRTVRRWLVAAATLVALLVAGAWLLVSSYVPSNEELARAVEAEFKARTGQPLAVRAARWRVRGTPVIELQDAHTESPEGEAVRVRRVAIYPQLLPLLDKRVVIERLEVDGAVVPRQALSAYQARRQEAGEGASVVLHTLVFRDLTYTSYSGVPVAYDGEIRFDDDHLPRHVLLRRSDGPAPATLEATREDKTSKGADIYRLQVQAGGGSANGQARLATSKNGHMTLTGELSPRNVEVQALLQSFNRRSFISGQASGQTTLRAEGGSPGELLRSLHTRSVLEVQRARVLRIDVDKAVRSLGEEWTGETALDSLTGVMDTQNTAHGMKTVFTQVKAEAGAYSATGKATLYRRAIDAQGTLAVGGGVVEVPFAARGPTRKPVFEMAWGSIAGAVIGTAVLPGIGTLLGAKIGGAVGGPPKVPETRQEPPARPGRR